MATQKVWVFEHFDYTKFGAKVVVLENLDGIAPSMLYLGNWNQLEKRAPKSPEYTVASSSSILILINNTCRNQTELLTFVTCIHSQRYTSTLILALAPQLASKFGCAKPCINFRKPSGDQAPPLPFSPNPPSGSWEFIITS